jgi:hypothetical protein
MTRSSLLHRSTEEGSKKIILYFSMFSMNLDEFWKFK